MNDDEKYIVREMKKAIGQANIILSEEKVLMGRRSNSKISLVYVSLERCKHEFSETPAPPVTWREGLCFCQYVSQQLSVDQWE
ncbi:hypothetical protein KUCAC02_035132 [Chaenocephalus aceratus]|nr:hypothetical protein KUCAC02_035132 [Chaenocephalus aceratus]